MIAKPTLEAALDLLARYKRVFAAAWNVRHQLAPTPRGALEREFLPAALELQDTPPSPLPRVLMWTLIIAFAIALAWSILGRIDTVASASGKIIPSTRAQVIQPIETAAVRRIHVADGQAVHAGDLLVELDATAAGAEDAQAREAWATARLKAERARSLLASLERGENAGLPALPAQPELSDIPASRRLAETQLLTRQFEEYRSRLRAFDGEIARAQAEQSATRELVAKLDATLPIARRREADYKNLVERAFVSQHGYLEQEQARIEIERDLAYQRAKLAELGQTIAQGRANRSAWQAEFLRGVTAELTEAEQQAASLQAEVTKTENKSRLMRLTAPVDGTVQQLAIHTEGGVVTPAQPLMVVVPNDYSAEVEAVLENKDVGFVKPGQHAEIKIETFPFTRYGTIPAEVSFISNDAVTDEQRGLVFPVRLKLERSTLQVDERTVNLAAGMAVTAEIKTGHRRVIEYFLSPVLQTMDESLGER
ncbi:HlyD family type I secretion periplasmic adaptor subunit [Thauera sinica]|uniref:Membrane fusion protein (MFP) family protein n=1 Tax=Thauera sinica TaxID=2665146 RepID=A0ABW1AXE1_9RHOO|nr:HlyD family type I secretion periplasmic adaptor subunit [Thauera sp. K11]ATE61106.1 hemolysin secretion protein D [Thauera sp. K11]